MSSTNPRKAASEAFNLALKAREENGKLWGEILKINPELERVASLVEDGMNEKLATKIVGLTDDEVREILSIHADTELSDTVIMTHVVKQIDKATKGSKNANQRVTQLDDRLSAFEQYVGELDLEKALKAGSEGGRKSFIEALRDAKVSDDEIRKVLVILDDGKELDLSDAQLFYELYSAYSSLHSRVEEHSTQISSLHSRVEAVENIKEGKIPFMGWVLAVGVFIAIWAIVYFTPISVTGQVVNNDGESIGRFTGGWSTGWLGFGLGLIGAGLVLLLSKGSKKTKTTEGSNEDTSTTHNHTTEESHEDTSTTRTEEKSSVHSS